MATNKKAILVTGGAGFIGSHLVDALLADKKYDKVVVIDNLSLPTESKDKKTNIRHNLNNPKLMFCEIDIKDKQKIIGVFEKERPSSVVHLAAIADTRNAVDEPQKYIDTNISGTLNLLEAAKNIGVEKFVFFSSSSVYGNKNKAPFTENALTDFSVSPYGASKKSGEILSHTYSHNFGLPVHVLRIFNAFGPRMRPNLVLYKWVKNILGGESIEMSGKGVRKRDYTYVGDIVDAVYKSLAVLSKNKNFEVFNIGNAAPVALKDLLQKTEKVLELKAVVVVRPSHKASVELTHASTAKAKKVLGWAPNTKFQDGIKYFIEWYKSQNK